MKDTFTIFDELKIPYSEVRASGGGARSQLWRSIQADVFGTEIVTINATEGPALGVALLAGVGTGVYPSVEEACKATIQITSQIKPDSRNMTIYNEYYKVYRALYARLKPEFDRVAEIVNQYS